jgi:hypothetical protein
MTTTTEPKWDLYGVLVAGCWHYANALNPGLALDLARWCHAGGRCYYPDGPVEHHPHGPPCAVLEVGAARTPDEPLPIVCGRRHATEEETLACVRATYERDPNREPSFGPLSRARALELHARDERLAAPVQGDIFELLGVSA